MPWFKMIHGKDGANPKIDIFGPIGSTNWLDYSGVLLNDFKRELTSLGNPTEIDVDMASEGGAISVGVPMYNLLRNHPAKINMRAVGEVSSIASVIFLAGDERVMPNNITSLIHDLGSVLMGIYNSAELMKIVDDMGVTREAILNIYEDRLSISRDEIYEIMKAETLMTAEQALAWGFTTATDDAMAMAASAEMVMSDHKNLVLKAQYKVSQTEVASLKDELAILKKPPMVAQATRVIELCESKGLESFSSLMIKNKFTENDVTQRLEMMSKVKDVCVAAKISAVAVLKHIDCAPEMVRVGIAEALAAADIGIDGHLPLDKLHGQSQITPKTVDATKIYAQRKP